MTGLGLASAAVGLSLASSITTKEAPTMDYYTSCEEEEDEEVQKLQQEQQQEQQNEEEQEEEDSRWVIGPDDPYYIVPEKDEPTECQMCLTFRQGPCRTDWKRFELCVKDQDKPPLKKEKKKDDDSNNDNETQQHDGGDGQQNTTAANNNNRSEEGSTACMKYAMPFYTCSHKHVNTYLILGNEQTEKAVIRPLMEKYSTEEAQSRRMCYNNNNNNHAIKINWQNWEGFVAALYDVGGHVPTKFRFGKTGFASAAEALKATWKEDKDGQQFLMMNDEGVPYLISVTADVPKDSPQTRTKDSKEASGHDGPQLMMTFALDQKGNLIGDARNKEFDADTKEEDESKGPSDKSTPTPSTTSTVELHIQLVPGVTEEFTIYSLYVPKDGDFLDDGVLVESKSYVVDEVTKIATQKAKEIAEAQQATPSSPTSANVASTKI